MGLAFFGLNLDNLDLAKSAKLSIYKQIHQICFHGKGGYSWPVVYNMPIYLRRFIFNEIKQFYEEEKKEAEKQPPNGSKQITPGPSKNSSRNPPKSPPKNTTVNMPVNVKYK